MKKTPSHHRINEYNKHLEEYNNKEDNNNHFNEEIYNDTLTRLIYHDHEDNNETLHDYYNNFID